MPSLIIQDAFAPYYANRESFPATSGSLAVATRKSVPAPQMTHPEARKPSQADKLTEH